MIRSVSPADDAGAICEIYNHYVTDTVVTFETEPVDVKAMRKRIGSITARFPYLVYEQDGKVLGYCYATTWRSRAAFDKTVETSVYIHKDWTGKALGYELYQELVKRLRSADFHVAVAGITLPNTKKRGAAREVRVPQSGPLHRSGEQIRQMAGRGFLGT